MTADAKGFRSKAVAATAMAEWPGEREGLSARESAIVSLIVTGMSNQEIASALYMSMHSVKTHILSAYPKMGVVSRTQAVSWGVHRGFEIAAPTTGR